MTAADDLPQIKAKFIYLILSEFPAYSFRNMLYHQIRYVATSPNIGILLKALSPATIHSPTSLL